MIYTQKSFINNVYIFEIKFNKDEILKQNAIIEKELILQLEIEGFRKGKVPFEIGKKHLDAEKVFQKTLSKLLTDSFSEIVKKMSLKTIGNPKIELINAKQDSDWLINLHIAIEPAFILPDYKKIIQDAKKNLNKADIWVPGKDKQKNKEANINKEQLLQTVFNELLKNTNIIIPDLVIENEFNNRLTQLIDDIRKAGLTIENYLQSKNLTKEKLHDNLKKEINEMYQLEFILDKISDTENIVVNEKDIENLLSQFEEDKKQLVKNNLYFYTTLLRRQKLLDYLSSV